MISTLTAIITPFRSDETIDYEKLKEDVRRQRNIGNGVFACGTNGDFSSLTFSEKVSIVETCLTGTDRDVPLIANAGCPSTYETLSLAKEFQNLGVRSVAVITPYFIQCTQEGLYRHFSTLADSLEIPVYMYEIPARTGNSIAIETIERLASHPNIAGIKDSSGSPERIEALSAVVKEHPKFRFFVGTDSLILFGLRSGASGCVSGLANLVPSWIRNIAESFEAGDTATAEALQGKVNQLRQALYRVGYPPAVVKRTLFLLDPSYGNNRLPAYIPDRETDTELLRIIHDFGLTHAMHA